MATNIELALMAGGAYKSTRKEINRFPVPTNWDSVNHETQDSGFEAVTFIREGTTLATSTEIVISYAGTYDQDLLGDKVTDFNLAMVFDQLGTHHDYSSRHNNQAPTK